MNLKDYKIKIFSNNKDYQCIIEIYNIKTEENYIGFVKNTVTSLGLFDGFDLTDYIKSAIKKENDTFISYYVTEDCGGKYIHLQFRNNNANYDGDYYNFYYTISLREKYTDEDYSLSDNVDIIVQTEVVGENTFEY